MVVLVATAAFGCACDPAIEASALVGSDATNCGYVPFDEDRGPVTDCLDAAIAAGESAFGGWQQLGRDSEVRVYYAFRPDRTYQVFYDGDIGGGGGRGDPRITVTPCDGPPRRSGTGYGCDGSFEEPYELCD